MSEGLEIERLKLDRYKAQLDFDRLNLDRSSAEFLQEKLLFDAVITFASLSIKALLIVNGMAVIILLGLLTITHPSFIQNSALLGAIHAFGIGTLASIFVVCFSYLAQTVFSEARSEKTIRLWGGGFRLIAIFAALWSIWCIFDGITFLTNAFGAIQGKEFEPSPPISITEYLQAFAPYAWPMMVIVIVLIFKNKIGDLLSRITRVGKDGAEFSSLQQEKGDNLKKSEGLDNSSQTQDPTLLPWLTKLDEEIVDYRNSGKKDADLVNMLKNALAANIRDKNFEKISRVIFGTQIVTLRRLAANEKIATSDLKKIHAEHVERAGEKKSDYTSWAGFLESNDLMHYEKDGFVLTREGLLYLRFANTNGIGENRWG